MNKTQQKDLESLQQLKQLAEDNNPDAQYQLGMLLANGDVLELDHEKAYEWFLKASEQGVARASSAIAWLYSMGYGVPQDEIKAGEWFIKAAEQGDSGDQFTVAGMYRWGRFGVEPDAKIMLHWYHQAASQGQSHAQHSLGRLYSAGKMVPLDKQQAYCWYSLAILSQHESAKSSLKALSDTMTAEEIQSAQLKMHELLDHANSEYN